MRFPGKRTQPQGGFTMIELVLVMVLLTAVVAFAAPRLAAFFRGRALDSEARRVLALTRYAQERAASEGIPMRMWFEAQSGSYGVEPDPCFLPENAIKTLDFKVPEGMRVQAREQTQARQRKQLVPDGLPAMQDPRANLPGIRFLPDGAIDVESMSEVTLTDSDEFSLTIRPSRNRMSYEIVGGTGG